MILLNQKLKRINIQITENDLFKNLNFKDLKRDPVLEAISAMHVFSFDDIAECYRLVNHSYDRTLEAIYQARSQNISLLVAISRKVRIQPDDLFRDLSFADLKRGDTIQNKGSGISYIVTQTNKSNAIAVRQIDISNESEWLVVR